MIEIAIPSAKEAELTASKVGWNVFLSNREILPGKEEKNENTGDAAGKINITAVAGPVLACIPRRKSSGVRDWRWA